MNKQQVLHTLTESSLKLESYLRLQIVPKGIKAALQIAPTIKLVVNKILSKLFPFEERMGMPSLFIQETWLEKNMRPLQVKDYLWTPSAATKE